jgi:hypothetical protein
VEKQNKGARSMKVRFKATALKRAMVLAAVLAMSGTALAKKPAGGAGVPADLSDDRTSATVTVSAQCDPSTQGVSGVLSVHIFQSVGRLINIGIGSGTVLCTNAPTDQSIVVNAIPGLAFQPGPATLIVKLTTVDPLTLLPSVSETGSRLNLNP